MPFLYTRNNLNPQEARLERFFQILPGLTSWTILIVTIGLSIFKPIIAAVLIIMFLFYWFLRLIYMTVFLILSYYRLTLERHTDWIRLIKGIDRLNDFIHELNQQPTDRDFSRRLALRYHKKELQALQTSRQPPPLSKDIYHLVIFPVVKEPQDIIEPGIESLRRQKFPPKHILVVFALEERAPQNIKDSVLAVSRKYQHHFLDIITIIHPSHIPGEAAVKGANVTYAAKHAAEYFQNKNIPQENIILSCFDADTIVGEEYFGCLTYHFMISPDRIQSSFQPIPVYHNNIWQVPSFARVIEIGSSFFQLIEATNPEKLVTFSSHSMSFKALVDVGYWPVDMISDDSAIFWKSYIHYEGQYKVVPMYVTLSMDIAANESLRAAVRSIYKQKRRWAWGVENFSIVMRGFLQSQKISLYDKMKHGFKLFEGHVSWATSGFILTVISWLPAILAEREFAGTVVYYNAPQITKIIFNLASASLVISIFLSIKLLPKNRLKNSWSQKLFHATEWMMIPFILVIFSSLPALDAQTRLMMKRHMEFWVADKRQKKT